MTNKPVPFAAVAAAAWGLCALQAATGAGEGLVLCPVRLATGRSCPGCGMGRAIVAAMRGDWARSWDFHFLGAPLLALWTGWLLLAAWRRLPRPPRNLLKYFRIAGW